MRYLSIALYFLLILMLSLTSLHAQPGSMSQTRKAEIVVDPDNPQNISGYVNLAIAWGTQLQPPQQFSRAIVNLGEALRRYSEISPTIENHVYLSSDEILRMPFVFVSTERSFELTDTEIANLRDFFDNGGFMFIDNAASRTEGSQAEASLKKMVRDVLGSQGRFAPIPDDHPLYHAYFDFDDGPPRGVETNPNPYLILPDVHYLEGVTYRGRLAVVYSNKGYVQKWSDLQKNEPQLKFGVNAIVFSLLQMKGLAGR